MLGFLGSSRGQEINDPAIAKLAWDDIVATANRHNDPGNFTALHKHSPVENETS
ncbi:MAG TPA: DUF3604 domain-containing protein [Gammaproteobacteria bacterium]|nr:DUF3604 domain-containing protein [Gammaproteobacteria bacterium]